MTERKKKPVNLAKAARNTTFYIFVVGIAAALMLPFYFIVSLSLPPSSPLFHHASALSI